MLLDCALYHPVYHTVKMLLKITKGKNAAISSSSNIYRHLVSDNNNSHSSSSIILRCTLTQRVSRQ